MHPNDKNNDYFNEKFKEGFSLDPTLHPREVLKLLFTIIFMEQTSIISV